jgi:hypothetical protein
LEAHKLEDKIRNSNHYINGSLNIDFKKETIVLLKIITINGINRKRTASDSNFRF